MAGVPDALLNPATSWEDRAEFEQTSKALAAQFDANFEQYKGAVPAAITAQGPGQHK